ncbi:hypothetical protein TRVL_10250 [Trypanosoma vivax]|nr:hypothetical protein TRVL_10250 [Trypanosoma vivax]
MRVKRLLTVTAACYLLSISLTSCVYGGHHGKLGSALLEKGGADKICELSGALKHVAWTLNASRGREVPACHKAAREDLIEKIKEYYSGIDSTIKLFISKNNKQDYHYRSVVCLATGNDSSGYKPIDGTLEEKLPGCTDKTMKDKEPLSITNASNMLKEKIAVFYSVAKSSYDNWLTGRASAFGRSGEMCPFTEVGGWWEIEGHGKAFGGLFKVNTYGGFDYPEQYNYPQIYWLGGDESEGAMKHVLETLNVLEKGGADEVCKSGVVPPVLPNQGPLSKEHFHDGDSSRMRAQQTESEVGENGGVSDVEDPSTTWGTSTEVSEPDSAPSVPLGKNTTDVATHNDGAGASQAVLSVESFNHNANASSSAGTVSAFSAIFPWAFFLSFLRLFYTFEHDLLIVH